MTAAAFPRPQTPRAMVQVDKLWSVFGEGDNAFAVHQDLDLTVYQGDMLSIVGGSGTGKTVLLRQILGFPAVFLGTSMGGLITMALAAAGRRLRARSAPGAERARRSVQSA